MCYNSVINGIGGVIDMDDKVQYDVDKINKNEFLDRIAKKNGIPLADVKCVYNAIIDEFKTVMCSGSELSLTGFGTFSLKKHKGHHVQFDSKVVDDYMVLKFRPSAVLMAKIRDAYADGVKNAASM